LPEAAGAVLELEAGWLGGVAGSRLCAVSIVIDSIIGGFTGRSSNPDKR
jgi:hypothetical protein